ERLKGLKQTYNGLTADLRSKSNIAQGQVREMPLKTQKFLELKRQVETKEGLYKILQEKREETAIGRASTISNSKAIDRANPSYTPIKPNYKSIRLMAILIGLALPAMFIFISEVIND